LFIPDPDPDFFTHPGSRGQKMHRIPDPDLQHEAFHRFLAEAEILLPCRRSINEEGTLWKHPPLFISVSLTVRTKTRREEWEIVVLPLLAGNMHMGFASQTR
jgi:hypothetical protein